ncbi:RNA-binding protein 7-like isoform X1 [Salvia splendens]|uniref:RNA-binding protein 7-like isoform X1 n=1 Tax=Salvia splendens TaxID=180675 RepID=UPI001C279E6B|nr:RNA-binding protein 7-like isoform X1 [Salvia splendens]
MADNPKSTVYIGNLDERVSDRVLYDILIQAGRVVDLYIPRDRETDKPKGYAFAEYESDEVAEYAVKLFSGLVTLYKRTLKFAISGQDRPSASLSTPPANVSSAKPRQHHKNTEPYSHSPRLFASCQFSERKTTYPEVLPDISMHRSSGYRSYHDSTEYDYSRRVFGSVLDSVSRGSSRRYDVRDSLNRDRYY